MKGNFARLSLCSGTTRVEVGCRLQNPFWPVHRPQNSKTERQNSVIFFISIYLFAKAKRRMLVIKPAVKVNNLLRDAIEDLFKMQRTCCLYTLSLNVKQVVMIWYKREASSLLNNCVPLFIVAAEPQATPH
jgi:hypothetical protein